VAHAAVSDLHVLLAPEPDHHPRRGALWSLRVQVFELIELAAERGDVDELSRLADSGNATAAAQLAEFTAEDASHSRDGLRSFNGPGP
jgi:hypothetical protein